jgi:hypothetical protein
MPCACKPAVALLVCCSTLRYLDLSMLGGQFSRRIPIDTLHALSRCAALETLVLDTPADSGQLAALRRLLSALPQLRQLKLIGIGANEPLPGLWQLCDECDTRALHTFAQSQGRESAVRVMMD